MSVTSKFILWCALWIAIAVAARQTLLAPPKPTKPVAPAETREPEEAQSESSTLDSIEDALYAAAKAAAPGGSRVDVDVDRFTEFVVTIASENGFTTNQMTATIQAFLPQAAKYLYSLRFAREDQVIAELDRADIEFVDDWSRATPERIAMLLPLESESAPTPTNTAQELQRERSISSLLQDDPEIAEKLASAQKIFFAAAAKADNDLRQAIDVSNAAVNFGAETKPNYVQRLDQVRAATEHGKNARAFWQDPPAAWRKALEAAGANAQAIQTLAESSKELLRQDHGKIVAVLDALDAKLESARYFLQARQDEAQPANSASALELANSPDRSRRALDQLREDIDALNAALRDLAESRR